MVIPGVVSQTDKSLKSHHVRAGSPEWNAQLVMPQSSTNLALLALLAGFLCPTVATVPQNQAGVPQRIISPGRFPPLFKLAGTTGTSLVEQGNTTQDCVRGAPVPILASRKAGTEQGLEKVGENEATEKATLGNGIELTVHQFGCEHYTVDFTFVWKGEKVTARSSQGWLKKAAELLQSVKVTTTQEKALRLMVETLRRSAARRYSLGTPLKMSEMETLTLTVKNFDERIKLELHYDVAL